MLTTYEQQSKRKLAATVISLVVVAGVVLFADHIKAANAANSQMAAQPGTANSAPATTNDDSSSTSSPSSSNMGMSSNMGGMSSYKDGSYTASSSYYVPHGYESIKVNLTLQNGAIKDVSINNSESDYTSASFQQDFASAYKDYVVGKKISGLQLGVVAGASDTTQGFNDAISQIASQAKG